MRLQARVVLVASAHDRQGKHQDQVYKHRYAAGEHGHDDENRAHPLDGNAGVGGQTLAYTEDPFAFLDPAKARRGATVRLGKSAIIENLVAWLDG